jgi:hypothetical protein
MTAMHTAGHDTKVYLGLCERYQELYQAQVAELGRLMATMPVPSDPRPLR